MIAAGRRVKVMPQMKVEQGITAARTIFGKCFFDAEKCADGIQALRHYRYEVEEAKSDPAGGHIALSKVPRHDWTFATNTRARDAVGSSFACARPLKTD